MVTHDYFSCHSGRRSHHRTDDRTGGLLETAPNRRRRLHGRRTLLQLQRRGYVRTAATANCGHPARQYDVALVDWRRRTSKSLEVALDWLVDFLSPSGVLVVWVDLQKTTATEALRQSLKRRGFGVEAGTVHDCGCAVSARRREMNPIRKAA